MVALFANMLKVSYYEYVMGNSTKKFIYIVAMTERTEQGIKSGKIFAPTENRGFGRKKQDVDHIKVGYTSNKNKFQNYNTPSPSSQIANINFNFYFPIKKPKTQNNQAENQSRTNYQRT